jgi:hypothetical protein
MNAEMNHDKQGEQDCRGPMNRFHGHSFHSLRKPVPLIFSDR